MPCLSVVCQYEVTATKEPVDVHGAAQGNQSDNNGLTQNTIKFISEICRKNVSKLNKSEAISN
jgi:hypothetical protein